MTMSSSSSSMKRSRDDNIDTAANWLMMLSRPKHMITHSPKSNARLFDCKTCNRQFTSFQALGGHRASHKRPKHMEAAADDDVKLSSSSQQYKSKTHECSICGLEFPIGQALGGHMRRHRATIMMMNTTNAKSSTAAASLSPPPSPRAGLPVFKRSNSSKRVLCLDLSLSPPQNDLEFPFEFPFTAHIKSPTIHCFI